jgi:hypothetical protein
LKYELALQEGLAYLSRYNSGWFCHKANVYGKLKLPSEKTGEIANLGIKTQGMGAEKNDG